MKRILLVEDEPQIADVVKRGLSYKGFDVMIAWTGEEVFTILDSFSPDLVVVDIVLPDIDGYEVCRRLRRVRGKDFPILILTARDETFDKVVGLESGADDYILKPFVFDEFLAHIRTSLRRAEETVHPPETLHIADVAIDMTTRRVTRAGSVLELTKRECDVLVLLAQHPGHCLTKEAIFQHIWGYENEAELEVVKVYVSSLQKKLNGRNMGNLIEEVQGRGYTIHASSPEKL